jgi:hypothetical protein
MLQNSVTTNLNYFVKAENECWRLAQNCARWAAEAQHRNVRKAFMAMPEKTVTNAL